MVSHPETCATTRLCHADGVMQVNSPSTAASGPTGQFVLGIDTCGPSGSVALGRLVEADSAASLDILGQVELEGRSYSATLIAAVGELLRRAGLALRDVDAIV